MEEGNKKVIKSICIKPELWDLAKQFSNKIGTSISTLIAMSLIEKMNKIEQENYN